MLIRCKRISVFKKVVSTVFFMFFSFNVSAGKLSDFESDVMSSNSKSSSRERCNDCDGDTSNIFVDIFFEVLFGGRSDDDDYVEEGNANIVGETIVEGGKASMERVDNVVRAGGISKRKPGDTLLPFLKFNITSQEVTDEIDGTDIRIEAGKGPFAAEFRSTRYKEGVINEKLDFDQLQGFYRMSVTNKIGFNIGVGYGQMEGNNKFDGIVLSMPFIFYNGRSFGWEVRPSLFDADGTTLRELDLSLLYAMNRIAIRVGYRTLNSPNEEIDGPYLGFDYVLY